QTATGGKVGGTTMGGQTVTGGKADGTTTAGATATGGVLNTGGVTSTGGTPLPSNGRTKMILNAAWKYYKGDATGAEATSFGDTTWTNVNLPHVFDTPYYALKKGVFWYVGYGWYRKHINVQAEWKASKRIVLEFEAAFQVAQVYVNGKLQGEHKGGFTGFYFDITDAVTAGDNVIAVRVNNLWNAQIAPRAGDWLFLGGIHRDVYLVVTDPLHVTWYGTFVTTPTVSATSATVNVKTEIKNENTAAANCTVKTTILDATNAVVTSMEGTQSIAAGAVYQFDQTSSAIANPHLWSVATPYMYKVTTTVSNGSSVVDTYESPLGIRSIQWTADQGFFMNGTHVLIDGINAHDDRAGWGIAQTNAGFRRDVKLMKEAGFNLIRECHNPHDVAWDDAADQLGIMEWAENDYWGVGGYSDSQDGGWRQSSYPVVAADEQPFQDNLKQQLTEFIRERRNHPSIIVWSMGNETFDVTSGTPMTNCKAFYKVLVALAQSLDPSRQPAVGGAQRQGFDQLAPIIGYNGDGATISTYLDPGKPSVITEYYDHAGVAAFPWRAGQVRWVGYGYGSFLTDNGGLGGVVDYYRLPGPEWYQYRQEKLGTAYTLPTSGTAAKIVLTADSLTIGNDGTDDTELTAQIVNASGTAIDSTSPITLAVTSGGGLFPTGTSMTFDNSKCPDTRCIRYGMAKMTMRSYTAGTITVTATSGSLPSASVTVTCVDKGGLASSVGGS
ncbi:MAG TPA: glycoside hydrolase family 2 TIM barrel-domain containing protein, partial [Polyangia bacterium]|nr:glycoside hydrolase family 2 TIM barrel-domain containing protein [Polyangia bacterium]